MHLPIPLRGPLSLPFKAFGIRPSRMNPNTCTICEIAFSRVMKARSVTIDATVMFADLRGYTTLTQNLERAGLTSLLDAFFPVRQGDHAVQALLAARAIQQRFVERRQALLQEIGKHDAELGIGIGIDSGDTNFGEFGQSHRDLTAIGTVVNRAARAQAAAKSGEILVTSAVRDRSAGLVTDDGRDFTLKGFEQPVRLFAA
jgi:adenylate cyclase